MTRRRTIGGLARLITGAFAGMMLLMFSGTTAQALPRCDDLPALEVAPHVLQDCWIPGARADKPMEVEFDFSPAAGGQELVISIKAEGFPPEMHVLALGKTRHYPRVEDFDNDTIGDTEILVSLNDEGQTTNGKMFIDSPSGYVAWDIELPVYYRGANVFSVDPKLVPKGGRLVLRSIDGDILKGVATVLDPNKACEIADHGQMVKLGLTHESIRRMVCSQ